MTDHNQGIDPEIKVASDARGTKWSLPMPGKRFDLTALRASALLPAAGAYELVQGVNVFKSRLFHLYLSISAEAANIISIIPEISIDPDCKDTTFYTIGISDGTVTAGDTGTSPGGNFTGNNMGRVTFYPMEIRTAANDSAADELRMCITIDVNQAYWIRFRIAEVGVTGTPATVALFYAKSV